MTTTLRGEARKVARSIVDEVRAAAVGEVLIYAGETTVTLRGDGSGGRNQELALAGSLLLDEGEAITILSIGSDGIDGPTETAGGFSDGSAAARARAAGIDLSDHLERNDSNPALTAIGDAVVTGPTGTNVGDLVLAVRHGE